MTNNGKTILVIDDDVNYLSATKELLEPQGYIAETYPQPSEPQPS